MSWSKSLSVSAESSIAWFAVEGEKLARGVEPADVWVRWGKQWSCDWIFAAVTNRIAVIQARKFENRICDIGNSKWENTARPWDGAGRKEATLSLNRLRHSLLGFYLRNCMGNGNVRGLAFRNETIARASQIDALQFRAPASTAKSKQWRAKGREMHL
jgi:hypothetical protein